MSSRKERFYEKNSIDDGPDGVFVAGVRLRERAEKVSYNLSQQADNFNVIRQLTVINCIEGGRLVSDDRQDVDYSGYSRQSAGSDC